MYQKNYENERENWKKLNQQAPKNKDQATGKFAARETNKQLCFYFSKNHWSDECKEYPDVKSRKNEENLFEERNERI